ncbi:6020_t:CDS:2, partial [Gigaspora margarita]
QLKINPWRNHLIPEDNINQLLNLNDIIKEILEIELYNFINEIIKIDNKKHNCSKCNTKLPTLISINQESSFQQIALSENTNKAIIFRSYNPKKSSIELQKSKI